MTNKEIAIALGKQVGLGKALYCPLCSTGIKDDDEQLMSSMGDYEDTLFCPHCDLYVELKVKANPSAKRE